MAARAPDLPLWPALLCALRKRGCYNSFLPSRARARGERRFHRRFLYCVLPAPAAGAADRAAQLRRRRRWPPGPPICRYGPRCCARSGKGGAITLFYPLARAREASADFAGDFFFVFCRRQPLVLPTALRSYAVAADGRPGPRFAAMARAAVRAQEKGVLF